jgi:hypothetical protein
MTKTLEQRVQALEDAQAIINLKTLYLDTANGGWNKVSHEGEKIAAMFTEDGHWELTNWATVKGRKDIRDTFDKWTHDIPFAVHMVSNPRLEVNGDTAKGKWNIVALSTHVGKDRFSGEDIMTLAVYNDDFVRVNGQWLFKKLHAEIIIQGPARGENWSRFLANFHKPVK